MWENVCEDSGSFPLELSDRRLQRDGVPDNRVIRQESETSGLLVIVDQPGQKPLVAYWGGVFLARDNTATPVDKQAPFLNGRTELVQRLLADACEPCGSTAKVQVRHIRAMKDLRKKGRAERPTWVEMMARRLRKTPVVCA